MTINRRQFLQNGFSASMLLSLRAAVTGIPVQFLLNGVAQAATGNEKFVLLALSPQGEAMNISAPGSFPRNSTDPAGRIVHPNAANFSNINGAVKTINDIRLTAEDFAVGANVRLGESTHRAARAYTALPQSFLNNLVSFWHQTKTNAHPEFDLVLKGHGALKNQLGSGSEELPSAIAQELALDLGTMTARPISFINGLNYESLPINSYTPRQLKELLTGSSPIDLTPAEFLKLYDKTVNAVYNNVKQNGTPGQKKFLDESIKDRSSAILLSQEIGSLLDNITGNDQVNQMRAALALFKVKLTPVVVIKHAFSNDNHVDNNLVREVQDSLEGIEMLNEFHSLAKAYTMENNVTFATMNVFGRTPKLNAAGGRDHDGKFTCGFIHSSHIKGGVVGGLGNYKTTEVEALGINSANGSTNNPNISKQETLSSFMKTVMIASGVSNERANIRIPDTRVVTSLFT